MLFKQFRSRHCSLPRLLIPHNECDYPKCDNYFQYNYVKVWIVLKLLRKFAVDFLHRCAPTAKTPAKHYNDLQ